ncbi:MAG: tRNA pseudouridine(13) synthase TruD, partial [Candidatus Ranarchaeia archaeon]
MRVPTLEKKLGMELYISRSPGIDGRIRQFPEDFRVEEILIDGSKADFRMVSGLQPSKRDRYLVCVLVKKNWDTFHAVQKITRHLGISEDRIQIAGIKDARAVTAQHISISRFLPHQVSNLNLKNLALYPIRFSKKGVFPDLLLGNQFRVVIRSITYSDSTINKRVKNVKYELACMGGFPNYFGHQRFGTIRPNTHLVGCFLTKGDVEKAALTFLAQPSLDEHPESREAREQLENRQDFMRAL